MVQTLGDVSPAGSSGDDGRLAAARRQDRDQRREAALNDLSPRDGGDREDASPGRASGGGADVGSGGGTPRSSVGGSGGGGARERVQVDRRQLDGLEQQLEDAEDNNAILENEVLRLHEELARQRREALRAGAAAADEVRALRKQCADAWEEREDALELLDESVAKAAALHRRLSASEEARAADGEAGRAQLGQVEAAKARLLDAVHAAEDQSAVERVARLKAEDEATLLRQQLAALKAEHDAQGGAEDEARAAAAQALEAEQAARRSLHDCVLAAGAQLLSQGKAALREAEEVQQGLAGTMAHVQRAMASLRKQAEEAEASRRHSVVQVCALLAQTHALATGESGDGDTSHQGGDVLQVAKARAAAAQGAIRALRQRVEASQARAHRQHEMLAGVLARIQDQADAHKDEPAWSCEAQHVRAALALMTAAGDLTLAAAAASRTCDGKLKSGVPEGPESGTPECVLFRGAEGSMIATSSTLLGRKRRRAVNAEDDGQVLCFSLLRTCHVLRAFSFLPCMMHPRTLNL